MWGSTSRFLVVALAWGCAAAPPPPPPRPTGPVEDLSDAAFARDAQRIYYGLLDVDPVSAVELGLHQYDGRVPDCSQVALLARRDFLHRSKELLERFAPGTVSSVHLAEREVLLRRLRVALFDLEVRRAPFINPMFYLQALDLMTYVARDYAPAAERARALTAVAHQAGELFAQARANLEPRLPRTFLDTALLQARGTLAFVTRDVPAALADPQLEPALAELSAALRRFADFLEARRAEASDQFALGEQAFLRMLLDQEGLEVDLATLEHAGRDDLSRNLEALMAAAHELAPDRPLAEVVRQADEDRPAADEIDALAAHQIDHLRRLIVERHLVSIPSEEPVEVKDAPPFMRYNLAFLRSAGVFESRRLPSFYLISPPDPSWPPAEQKAYLPSKAQLFFVTAHEVLPGHFLHHLFRARYPTPILRSFGSYATGEGWAHYAEELVWEAGALGRSPAAHIGQLKQALLRDVRYLAAIGLHCRGMTVAEAERLFVDKAFADAKTAHQQAVRGTFDPGYLNYTLGKLMIRKLRDDYQRKAEREGGFQLQTFHDRFLSAGFATVPEIRRALLGEHAGSPL
jgi:hypothetical protein